MNTNVKDYHQHHQAENDRNRTRDLQKMPVLLLSSLSFICVYSMALTSGMFWRPSFPELYNNDNNNSKSMAGRPCSPFFCASAVCMQSVCNTFCFLVCAFWNKFMILPILIATSDFYDFSFLHSEIFFHWLSLICCGNAQQHGQMVINEFTWCELTFEADETELWSLATNISFFFRIPIERNCGARYNRP